MRCPSCHHDNRADRRFCTECGATLAVACPSCGAPAEAGEKFCGGCGARLPSVAPAPGAPPRTPEPETALPAGERRQLTVLFCDLVGSTPLSQQLDAEEWRDVIALYQQAVSGAVGRFGGHVAKHLGDGLLIYFGWPTAREDGPERAIRAGLAIVEAVKALAVTLLSKEADRSSLTDNRVTPNTLSVRVGMHTGGVVIGEDGEVFGETANIAARVQAAAEPDTVVISAATQRLVAGIFVAEDRGAHALKGVRAPVQLYRVVQPSGMRSRLDLSAGRHTPFVGRQSELGVLADAWERVVEGMGQTVFVQGEAGIGKSRLCYQFRAQLSDQPHTWLECRCSPYTTGTPFRAIIELIEQALTFQPADTPADKLGKLRVGLERGGFSGDDNVALLAEWLELPESAGYAPLALNPDVKRRKALETLAAWNLKLAELQPTVVLVEDLHWCDPSSLELLGRLVAQSATARVLLIRTARPEFANPWPAHSNQQMLSLSRLTKRQTREMIAAVSAARALPEAVMEQLVTRADGIPLFAEELTQAVVEAGTEAAVAEIPMTLQDSLLARLDRLSTAKEVAQRAAVLGREFSYSLLAAVAGMNAGALQQGLARLVEAELVFVSGIPPEATYTFKHVLVQEAAYESLLKRTRLLLHARIARTLEQHFADHAVREPETVARHYEAARLHEQAVYYYQRAAGQALVRSAHEEAIGHLRRALELVQCCPAGRERDERELMVQLALGNALAGGRSLASAETQAAYERARELSESVGDDWQLAPALWSLSVYYTAAGMLDRGLELARQLQAISERTHADEHLLSAHEELAVPLHYRGNFAESLMHCERAIEVYNLHCDRARNESTTWVYPFYPTEPGVPARIYAGLNRWQLGYPDQALRWLDQAEQLARAYHHPYSIAFALVFYALLYWVTGDPERQAAAASEVIATCEQHRLPMWLPAGKAFAAGALAAQGHCDAALQHQQEAMELSAHVGGQLGLSAYLALHADVRRAAGDNESALSVVMMGLSVAEHGLQHFWDADLQRLDGDLLFATGGPADEAAACYHRALAIAREQGARSFELRAATSLARLWRDQGKRAEARDLLAPVYDWFTEGFDTRDLQDAKALLEELQ